MASAAKDAANDDARFYGGGTLPELSRILGRLFAGAGNRPALPRYGIAVLLPILALALTVAFVQVSQAPFFALFSLSVLLAAGYGGTKAGLLATGCSILANLLMLPPAFTFQISDPDDIMRLVAFGLAAVAISALVGTAGSIQRKLDIERRRLDVTLRSIGDAVITTDSQGRITFMNAVAEEATGWKSNEAAGRPLPDIFNIVNESTRIRVANPVEKVLRLGRIVGLANHTILLRRDRSELPIDDSAAPIVNGGVLTGVVLVFRDISESKKSAAALLQAEKLASVGRLAATIAHEINNPLEAVTNLLYLIHTTDDLSAVRSLATAAQQELARAAHVTKQTLSFARQGGTAEETNLSKVVDGVVLLYESKARAKNISIVKSYRGDGMMMLSRNELRQVISNILSNALDAEDTGGRIDVRVHSVDGRVRLAVADRGCGISTEHMGRLYQPFFTMKQDVGTGLGLWVTKQIVDAQSGRIRVRSRLGQGTVFAISWPMASAQESVQQAATANE